MFRIVASRKPIDMSTFLRGLKLLLGDENWCSSNCDMTAIKIEPNQNKKNDVSVCNKNKPCFLNSFKKTIKKYFSNFK